MCIRDRDYTVAEKIGLYLSGGILLATNGINVAHELCHRRKYYEKFIGKALFLPCLYMHFYIEHNFGHHVNVGTPKDGATAKYKQSVYSFWITSVSKQYVDAWKMQLKLLKGRKNIINVKKKKDRIVALRVPSFYIGRTCRKRFDYINMTKGCSLPKKLGLLYNDNLITLKLLTRV